MIWHAATVLRGRRERFLLGPVLAAIGVFFLLQIVNPESVIARTNISRMAEGKTGMVAPPSSSSQELTTGRRGRGRTGRTGSSSVRRPLPSLGELRNSVLPDASANPLDMDYLKGLSADAAPALREGLVLMSERDREALEEHLLQHTQRNHYMGRNFNVWSWSRWRAGRASQ